MADPRKDKEKEMTFDPTKPCTTRDGREVRLFSERMKNGDLVGAVTEKDGCEVCKTWEPDGRTWAGLKMSSDLINIPEKRTVWVNFYRDGGCSYHDSIREANYVGRHRDSIHFACVKVEFEEGEGL